MEIPSPHVPTTTSSPQIPHVRHTEKINHVQVNESEYSDSSGGYNYPEYNLPVIPPYDTQEEYHQQNGYQEVFYENYPDTNEMLSNYLNYPQTQRPFSASSSSCSSVEGSSSEIPNQFNYTNLVSFYGHNQTHNGRPVVENFGGTFGKITPSPAVQEGGYASVIVDNTQQFHNHGGGVNEFVHWSAKTFFCVKDFIVYILCKGFYSSILWKWVKIRCDLLDSTRSFHFPCIKELRKHNK